MLQLRFSEAARSEAFAFEKNGELVAQAWVDDNWIQLGLGILFAHRDETAMNGVSSIE